MGLGPDLCLERNPELIYGRITGYGREGPLAAEAGHDINYISVAGPSPPSDDEAKRRSLLSICSPTSAAGGCCWPWASSPPSTRGRSQAWGRSSTPPWSTAPRLLTTMLHEIRSLSLWHDERGTNSMDTGSHYYNVYETADGTYVSVGAMEARFYRTFMTGLGFSDETMPPQDDQSQWETLKQRVGGIFLTRTRAEWLSIFDGTDACVTPVLSLGEAPDHPHNRQRSTFVDVGGIIEPAPAPRFSRTPPSIPTPAPAPGDHPTDELLRWGTTGTELDRLVEDGIVD